MKHLKILSVILLSVLGLFAHMFYYLNYEVRISRTAFATFQMSTKNIHSDSTSEQADIYYDKKITDSSLHSGIVKLIISSKSKAHEI